MHLQLLFIAVPVTPIRQSLPLGKIGFGLLLDGSDEPALLSQCSLAGAIAEHCCSCMCSAGVEEASKLERGQISEIDTINISATPDPRYHMGK